MSLKLPEMFQDIALSYLLSRKEVKQEKDSNGFTVYKVVA
jgi:hypothetical protein